MAKKSHVPVYGLATVQQQISQLTSVAVAICVCSESVCIVSHFIKSAKCEGTESSTVDR